MLNNYAESSGGFSNNHGQTSRTTAEAQKQQNIGSTWGYNSQLEGMYYGAEPQPMFMAPYEGNTKHSNYPQYPTGTIHQPVPTPVVKCHEACCQHYQDHRYPLNPAPLRYQPSGPIQPRYADLTGGDTRQYFTDRRSMQPSLSRKKVYPTENGYQNISDRHFPQYMGRGQMHMADSRQQMQMMRSQYPMYPPYWGGARGWTGPRMNCPPPPPYHQSVSQGAQLQAGLKMTDTAHYLDPTSQKSIGSQHRRGVSTSGGGTEIIRPVPEPKRSTLNPNLQSCHEFGYPTGFVPFGEVNKGGGMPPQSNSSTCKIPNDKQYHPHQMQYTMQNTDRNMMNCSNAINDLSYSMNFPMVGSDSYLRPGIDDNQQISDARKLQYDSSIGKKRPDLDLRQYLSTWEDDEDESTRLTDSLNLGNSAAPFIVVDCRSLEGEPSTKLQERFKNAPPSQVCTSKSRSSSPTTSKRVDELSQQNESSERGDIHSEFQTQTTYTPAMPNLINDSEKSFWNGTTRESDGIIGKGGAFQPLDCSKRDVNVESKRSSHPHNEISSQKVPGNNESANMSFDALVSFYGDNRRTADGGYDFVEMTERLVNNSEKSSTNNRTALDQHPEISRPCDPRLQQSQLGNNPSIYNKVAPRYPANNYQHFKPNMGVDPYYNYKHPMAPSKYFGFDNSQMVDPNYDYHKIISEFDSARLFGSKEPSKDPRRMYHPEVDKSLESAFIDPIRKTQIADCFQDKTNLEFASVDADQFMTPIIMKKSDLDNRIDKNNAIRERMEAINNENRPEKTVLITSQNGPSEIFRVPYSPEKDNSNKDNVVTLHSGDQTKSNTITVEVPYVQQYSTLVKLSEEISRSDKNDKKSTTKTSESNSTTLESTDDFKKPTSFKLKRLPNSKEWTVAEKNFNDMNRKTACENSTPASQNDLPLPLSNLNMPSLDDIRDGDETCETSSETHPDKVNDESASSNCDNNKTLMQTSTLKNNLQTPQMAVVQPMKLNQSKSEEITNSNSISDLNDEGNVDNSVQSVLNSVSPKNINNAGFEADKISSDSSSQIELISESDNSKHENFRSHKKIQNVSNVPNCLPSPNEEFLNPQDLNPGDGKEAYSPFHDYSDCDMNSHISDYFKLDERTASDKILDSRMPSSPGVEAMFEDINHSNQNQLYQSKSCNFQDLTDPNMVSISSHNTDFQSFSNIFSEDSDKGRRSDGSVLQMNDKKYFKQILDDIDNQQVLNSLEEQENDKIETQSGENMLHALCNEKKTSPPIPPISLKLNETKKIWCIAKKEQEISPEPKSPAMDSGLKSTESTQDDLCLENDYDSEINLANLQDKNINSFSNNDDSLNHYLKEKEHNYCFDKQNKSIINQLMFNRVKETNDNHNFIIQKSPINQKSIISEQSNTQSNSVSLDTDLIHSNVENECRTVVKYHPKVKVLHKLKSLNSISSRSEVLVFDEKGIHFPKQHYDEVQNDSMSVVQDLLDTLITQSINISKMTLEKMIVDLPVPLQSNETNNVVCVDLTSNVNAQSVITFDNSRYLSQRENCITKTTEVFIQHEKDNYHHQSVITTFQSSESGCNVIEKKNAVRSIFSPMSEDNEEDFSDINTKDNLPQGNTQKSNILKKSIKNGKNLFHLNKSNPNVDENALDCSVNKTVISSVITNSIENLADGDKICKANLKDKKNHDDEVFRGFDSPNNGSGHSKEEFMCKKDSFEIDDALELMGLCSDKNEDEPQLTSASVNSEKHQNSTQESMNSIETENLNGEFVNDYLSSPSNHCSSHDVDNKFLSSETTDQNEVNNISSSISTGQLCINIASNRLLDTIETTSNSHITDNAIVEEVKLKGDQRNNSCILENPGIQEVTQSTESRSELSKTTPHNLNDTSFLQSSIHQPYVEASDKKHPSDNEDNCSQIPRSQKCRKRTVSIDTSINPNFKISKQTTKLSEETSGLHFTTSNNNTYYDEHKSIKKTLLEDCEARLETSVIVRNNSSNSVICSQFSETSVNLCKSPILPSPAQRTEVVFSSPCSLNEEQIVEDSTKIFGEQASDLNLHKNEEALVISNSVIVPENELNSLNCNNDEQNNLKLETSLETSSKVVLSEDKKCDENNILATTEMEMVISNGAEIPSKVSENVCIPVSYCVGESAFLSCDDEIRELLKSSKLSYFYEYKRYKWKKFTDIQKNNQFGPINQCNDFNREYTVNRVNKSSIVQIESLSVTNKDIPHSSVDTLYPLYSDAQQINKNKNSSHEIGSQLQTENSLINYQSPFLEKVQYQSNLNSLSSTEICQDSEFDHQNNFQKTEVCITKSEETVLRNKHYLTEAAPKELDSYSLNRDSLKMIETETILKEIFSPDLEECGSGNSITNADTSFKGSQDQSLSEEDRLSSGNTSKSLINCSSTQDKENHIESDYSEKEKLLESSKGLPVESKISNLTDDYILLVLSQETMDSADKASRKNDDIFNNLSQSSVSDDQVPTDKISFFKKFDLNETPIKVQDQCLDKESEPYNSEVESSTDDSYKRALLSCDKSESSWHHQNKNFLFTNSSKSNNLSNSDLLFSNDYNTHEMSIKNTNELFQSTTKHLELSKQSVTVTPLDRNFVSRDVVLTEKDSLNENISCDEVAKKQKVSDLSNKNYEIDDISFHRSGNNKKISQHNTDSIIETNTKQDMDKENFISLQDLSSVEEAFEESSEIIEKDILLSKEVLQKGFDEGRDFESHLSNSSFKKFLKRGRKTFSDSQKRKVSSVQDSLKTNHNLNQETFPLQCLVEAALALENVDSKQMLINDSNFADIYSQQKDSREQFASCDRPEINNINSEKRSIKTVPCEENKTVTENSICNENVLTPTDKEIFSKFEETNYNFRASTRIVTSSSSNIIPYPKRKYIFKSKLSSTLCESKKNKSDSSPDKNRIKKRRGCFTYPRSKKRKKTAKDKQKYNVNSLTEDNLNDSEKNCLSNTDSLEAVKIGDKIESIEEGFANSENLKPNVLESSSVENCLNFNPDHHLSKDSSQTDFGGPLLIGNDKNNPQRNIFCVHVNSDKMDDYVNNINLEELEVLSDNNQTSIKDNSIIDQTSTDVSLENGTSLVIIIEELEDHSDKRNFNDVIKGESDIILGSIEENSSVSCLQQSTSILDDCSDILNTGFSVNEPCICPPEFEMSSNCDNSLLKEQSYVVLQNDSFISKPSYEMNDGLEDDYGKYSVSCNEEVLAANCYEDMNTNLVSDIGNWPFVEEEVAEFDIDPELPNKIPEEGRKIELKCSLPWKKIFNMSKKKKNKTSKKVSGLELGPAKVEVRLKAPSAEWKVISDYHENTSPVVKVKRLILQRDSDLSSFSEKDSEEENENKKNALQSSLELDSKESNTNGNDYVNKNKTNSENWQPVVLLTRNKELDELTLSLDSKLNAPKEVTFCPQSNFSENKLYEDALHIGSETSELSLSVKGQFENETHQSDSNTSSYSHFSESSPSSQHSEQELDIESGNQKEYEYSYRRSKGSKGQVYETYSPSGCNRALSDENIYSPSDPHFSPDVHNQNSETGSCEDIRYSCDVDNDVFLDTEPMSSNQCNSDSDFILQVNNSVVKDHWVDHPSKTTDNSKAETEDAVQLKRIDGSSPDSSIESCSNNSYDVLSNHLITEEPKSTLEEVCSSKEEEGNDETSNDESSQVSPSSEELSNNFVEELRTTDSPVKTLVDHRKNTRRKMPKNFFVRKKFRKATDEKSTCEVQQNELSAPSSMPNSYLLHKTPIGMKKQHSADSSCSSSVESYQSDSQSRKSSLTNDERLNNSESDKSELCEKSRLQCDYDSEDPLPRRLNELPQVQRFDDKQRLRAGGRGIKRPCEGHSREDTKRRRKMKRRYSNVCRQEYDARLQTKKELGTHVHCELHHCLLCHRSFSSATRYHLHKQGRSHRHLELTQRHTVHTIHRLLVGTDCPRLPPLSRTEQQVLQWRPDQSGFTHVYHNRTPLQTALQKHNEVSGDSPSEKRLPND